MEIPGFLRIVIGDDQMTANRHRLLLHTATHYISIPATDLAKSGYFQAHS